LLQQNEIIRNFDIVTTFSYSFLHVLALSGHHQTDNK